MPVLRYSVRSAVSAPPVTQNPTRPSSNIRLGFAVEACSEFQSGIMVCISHRARSEGLFHWEAVETRSIFLKTDLIILEDSLCAPGSPLLRSKDATRYLVS